MTKKDKQIEREQALKKLKGIKELELVPGDTIYTTLVHCSRSGMYRVVGLYVLRDNAPHCISRLAGAINFGYDERHHGAKVYGCGSDAGWELIYNLGRALFPDGFQCTGRKCPSNDHSNGDSDYTKHLHTSGGYAFHHRWM